MLLPFLAACQTTTEGAPAGFAVADQPIPEVVMAAVPADARLDQIVVRDGCYYLAEGGGVSPIVTEEMRRGGFTNQPYCIG